MKHECDLFKVSYMNGDTKCFFIIAAYSSDEAKGIVKSSKEYNGSPIDIDVNFLLERQLIACGQQFPPDNDFWWEKPMPDIRKHPFFSMLDWELLQGMGLFVFCILLLALFIQALISFSGWLSG